MIVTLSKTAESYRDDTLADLDRFWRVHRLWTYLPGVAAWIMPLVGVILAVIFQFWVTAVVLVLLAVLLFVLSTRNSLQARQSYLDARQAIIDTWAGSVERGQILHRMGRQLAELRDAFPDTFPADET